MRDMATIKERFIVSDEIEQKILEKFIERLLAFCKVTESGRVIVERTDITNENKIRLAIVARYLASRIETQISPRITSKELSDYLLMPQNQVNSRLKELKDKKIINFVERGVYEADPTKIESFIKELENTTIEGM
jgi:hypothetical protein